MPVQQLDGGGITVITGSAVFGMRARICLHGLRFYAKYGSSMRLARNMTPAALREVATEFTGRTYARSKKGMATALADMETLFEGKSLDQMGETRAVNAAVGGVAADLST